MTSSSGLNIGKKRLLYYAWRRGTREMDMVLGKFIDARIHQLTPMEAKEFELLLAVADNDLLAMLMGKKAIPREIMTIFNQLKRFNYDSIKKSGH